MKKAGYDKILMQEVSEALYSPDQEEPRCEECGQIIKPPPKMAAERQQAYRARRRAEKGII